MPGMTDTSPLTERLRQDARRLLLQQRRFRTEQLEDLAAQLGSTIGEPHREVAHALTGAAHQALRDIEAALRRLDDGSYGDCGRCRQPIRRDRLEAVPTSRYCSPCQYAADSRRTGGPTGTRPARRRRARR
jgi:DnaK suppressor protein